MRLLAEEDDNGCSHMPSIGRRLHLTRAMAHLLPLSALSWPGYDGIDNDGDGLIDKLDEDCWRCGDGILDPDEQCE